MISSIRPPSTSQSTSKSKRGGGASQSGGFAPTTPGASETSGAKAVVSAGMVASIDAVMALQTVDDPAGRKARSMQRGVRILDDLDDLKIAILEGRVPLDRLERIIAKLAAEREASGDDGLDDVLDGIDLRAQVELAKLGR